MGRTTETLVLDASVAAKWHLQDEESAADALAILTRYVNGELRLVAPDHVRYEIASSLTVATLGERPRLSRSVAERALDYFLQLGIETIGTDQLIRAAFQLVHRHGIAFYDALYLALADDLGVPLITADRRFYQRVRALPHVLWLGSYLAS